jgi:hypothetical protein
VRRCSLLSKLNQSLSILCTLFALCSIHLSGQSPPPNQEKSEATARVRIEIGQVGREIPADFLGFSYEAPVLADDDFDVRNTQLLKLLANLGKGTLRYGGHSVELTAWSRTGRPKAGDERAVLTPDDLNRLFAFSKAVDWRVILGLNLAHGDPSLAADEAAYSVRHGGAQLWALEIGNEPDLYVQIFKLRPPSWGYQEFRREFKTYLNAIHAREPHAPIAGPATARAINPDPAGHDPDSGPTWFPDFLKDEGSGLVLATSHLYPMIANPSGLPPKAKISPDSPRYASIANMLSPGLVEHAAKQLDQLASLTASSRLPLRIDETNSAARGGQDGVSNVFAAALWGADYAFTLAEHGAEGLNFHGSFACRGGYTPICRSENGYVAQPLYFGMLLFHAATPGRVVPVSIQSSANLAAHAVFRDDGRLAVVLINKDSRQWLRVAIDGVKSYKHANVLRLIGQALDNASGITFGGHPVAVDGSWSPGRAETLIGKHHTFEVNVPPASALVARFEK